MTEAARYGVQPESPDGITPAQTVGPFFAYALTPHEYGSREIFSRDLVTPDAAGRPIRIEGYVVDGDGEPIVDAMIEIWQADADGHFAGAEAAPGTNTAFNGFGRSDLDSNGFYSFRTVKPGQVPGPNGSMQAPHINMAIFARGLLKHLFTRIYFEGEAANATDPILALVPEDRRPTLIATRSERRGEVVHTFDIRLQGESETVFFEA